MPETNKDSCGSVYSVLDSALFAWTRSAGWVKTKIWDSWDWKENLEKYQYETATASTSTTLDRPRFASRGFPSFTEHKMMPSFVRTGSLFVRLAGLSGATAVALGAYGAHTFNADKADMKKVYDTANFYHFIHTVALLAVPLSRKPVLTGALMVSGMTVFCGTIYYHALTEEKSLRKFTPYGGMLLIAAWLSMVV